MLKLPVLALCVVGTIPQYGNRRGDARERAVPRGHACGLLAGRQRGELEEGPAGLDECL